VRPETFGLTLVEALYAGLPVVTTAIGGGAEVVDDSCGVRVRPSVDEVAASLRRLITDPEARRALGERGPARARELSDPALRIPELAAALGRVAAGGRAG
jgi:glycosyltransferase involved in cell wall biosynthesis